MKAPLPPLAPVSRRIQHHAARMGVARLLGVASRPIEFPFLELEHEAPVRLREETLLAPRGNEERPMERPPEVENQLGVCTPQFILRNTARITHESEERLSFQRVEAILPPEDHAALLREALAPPPPLPPTSRDALRDHLAERADLMLKPWNARYGRPDPV